MKFLNHHCRSLRAVARAAMLVLLCAPVASGQMPQAGTTTAQAVANPQAAAARGPKVVRLTTLSWREFETALAGLFEKPLPAQLERNGEWARYTLNTRGGRVDLIVDRTAGQVALEGPVKLADAWAQIVTALDKRPPRAGEDARVMPLGTAQAGDVVKAVTAIQSDVAKPQAAETENATVEKSLPGNRFVSMIFQAPAGENAPAGDGANPPAADEGVEGGLVGQVQIEFLEGLDVIVIRGNPRDVERVTQIINDIERLSAETQPTVEVYQLKHVGSDAMATLVRQLYDTVLSPRQGRVNITPLTKPNALLLIGRDEAVKSVIELVKKLDVPVGPSAMFQVFPLKYAAAQAAQQTVNEFFAGRVAGLGGRPLVVSDFRTNALIVQASPRDLQEVNELLKKIDVTTSAAVNELRVFPLRNSLAQDLAPILQNAISGQLQQQQQRGGQQPFQLPQQFQQPGVGGAQPTQPQSQNQQNNQNRSTMLRFVTVDGDVKQGVRSGILTDVRITADPRANTLLVSAPAESMELVAALIAQLDQMPSAESQIKVFTIANGDAPSLITMLESLFGQRQNQTGGGGFFGGGNQTGGTQGESTLVPLRFSADQRTNSIIASGSAGDLAVVEAILLKLDESDVRTRKSLVYRLKNAPAIDVANAITQFLTSERTVQQTFTPQGVLNPFEQIEREVVVVPEPVSNSLIVSATPRFFDEIQKLIEQIDARPPMVMIQVLIAEVTLNNTDEFGVEIGLQDSILFDRSLIGDLVTRNITNTLPNGTQTTTQQVVGASNTPGFNFNNQSLGNSGSDRALDNSARVGTQGLSNFSVGRINNELGFGGFVFSASSESVSVLLRALAECRRLDVLSRPQITTLDNQPAYIQVGQRVPRINATTITQTGQTNSVVLENVGIILGVTPRISPDGLVVMEIDAEKSDLGPEAEGIPVSINENGQVIRSPIYNTTTAQTTVSAVNGQTVVLGGLITSSKQQFHRRVPYLSNIPILGHLFRYDGVAKQRTELLIIMTPRIIRSETDAERIKHQEAARMSWCLGDVIKMHGESGLRQRADEFGDHETVVVYPDLNPDGSSTPQLPAGASPANMQPTPARTPEELRGPPPATQPPPEPFFMPAPRPTPTTPVPVPVPVPVPTPVPVPAAPLGGAAPPVPGTELRIRSTETGPALTQ